MYVEQVRRNIWCVTPAMPALRPASLSTRNRKLFVLIAVPRLDGKITNPHSHPWKRSARTPVRYRWRRGARRRNRCPPSWSQAVALLVVPAQREHFSGTQAQHQEHADDQPIAVAQVEQYLRYLLRREMDAGRSLARARHSELPGGFFDEHFQVDGFFQHRAEVDADLREDAFGEFGCQFVEVGLQREFVEIAQHGLAELSQEVVSINRFVLGREVIFHCSSFWGRNRFS